MKCNDRLNFIRWSVGQLCQSIYLFIYLFIFGGRGGWGGASLNPVSDRLPSNQSKSRDCSATVGAASIGLGSHYTETARRTASEMEMKIKERMRGKGKNEKKK